MRNRLPIVLLGFGLLLVGLPTAAQDSRFYVEVGVNRVETDTGVTESQLLEAAADQGIESSVASIDDNDNGFRIAGGWRPNRYFALELGYSDLGKVSLGVQGTQQDNPVRETITADTTSFTLDAVGSINVTRGLALFAKVGGNFWSTDANLTTSMAMPDDNFARTLTEQLDDSGTDLRYGAGLQYTFQRYFGLRLEYERYELGDASSDVYGLLALFLF